jgi:CDP-4-dehydro-6-deoxyglucose reductase, E1
MFRPKVDRISYGGAIIDHREKDAINRVIDSQGGSRWTVGEESVAFEKELAEKTGVKRAVVVNSGSSALLVALTALKLPKGSKVIIPAVNFPTAFNAIIQCGLVPYVVDIDPKTLNLDLIQVEYAVTSTRDIKAVIAVNIASNPVDLIKLRNITKLHSSSANTDIKIILDNCDGYGTLVNGEFAEKQADISCVSFHAAHIITTGEGGACLTDDEELANRCLKLREWGRASGTDEIYEYPGFPEDYRSRYVYEEIGYNMKPLELQCAMGRVQLTRLEGFREKRLANEKLMRAVFEKYPQFTLIESPKNADVCWFSFPLLCKGIKRKLVMDTLEANNIECRTIFSGNVLRHPAYKDTEYVSHGEMVNADIVMRDGMFLSVHPSITPEMIAFIDEVIGGLCK